MDKAPRTKEQIEQEYRIACAQLGEAEYHRSLIDNARDGLVEKLRALNEEAAQLKNTPEEVKPVEEVKDAAPTQG